MTVTETSKISHLAQFSSLSELKTAAIEEGYLFISEVGENYIQREHSSTRFTWMFSVPAGAPPFYTLLEWDTDEYVG